MIKKSNLNIFHFTPNSENMSKNQNVIDRFFDKVDLDENSGCWNFTSSISRTNNGRFYYNYKCWDAYVIGYILLGGEIPKGYLLHHICENRLCVNPEHLMPVTRVEHQADLSPTHLAYINKHKTHCKRGHPYTEENLVKGNIKGRSCRICAVKKTGDYHKAKRKKEIEQGINPDKRYKFTEDQRKDIKNSLLSTKELMVKYGVSNSYLYALKRKFLPQGS